MINDDDLIVLEKLLSVDKLSYKEAAKILSMEVWEIKRAAYKHGIKYSRVNEKFWSPEEISLLKDLTNKGLSYEEISEYFPGKTSKRIKGYLRTHKKSLNVEYLGDKRRYLTKEKELEVVELALKNRELYYSDIARKVNLHASVVSEILKKYNIKKLTKEEKYKLGIFGNIKTDLTEENLIKEISNGNNLNEIGRKFGLSPKSVKNSLEELKIDRYLLSNKIRPSDKKGFSSFGEMYISECLEELDIPYSYNVKIPGVPLDIRESGHIFIDFIVILDNKKYWIEYNGLQHYRDCWFFKDHPERFNSQLKRDDFIKKYCKKNNISFIEISFENKTKEDIMNILSNIFKRN